MKHILLIIVFLFSFVFSQQFDYITGWNAVSGDELTGSQADMDSTGTTTYTILIDYTNYYPIDLMPVALGDSSDDVIDNSDRPVYGTIYLFYDANEATDSLAGTVKSYAGVRGSTSRSYASIKWEPDATTLLTINSSNDTLVALNIYTTCSAAKQYPPEYIKLVVACATGANAGTDIYWRISMPMLYEGEKENW